MHESDLASQLYTPIARMKSGMLFLGLIVCGLFSHSWCCAEFNPVTSGGSEVDGFVQVCVSFTEPVENAGVVNIASSPLNLGATVSVDFQPVDVDLMVPESQEDDVCTNVTINADSIIEFAELFQMTFNSPTIPLCNPSNQLSITIQDSTPVELIFTDRVFTSSNENNVVDACVSVANSIQFDSSRTVSFTIVRGELGTASVNDLLPLTETITIDSTLGIHCQPFGINTDMDIEEDECFNVTISSSESQVVLVGGDATVVITDDDGADLSLSSTSATVLEGDSGLTSVSLCVVLDSSLTLSRDVGVLLNTVAVSATPGVDYEELNDVLLIIPSDSPMGFEVCRDVFVKGDDILEPDEAFNVILETVDSDDTLSSLSFRVEIEDDGDVIRDCGTLTNPPNGEVSFSATTQGNSATYSCDTGFDLTGTDTRTCQNTGAINGVWSNSEPSCNIVTCPSLPNPTDGSVEFDSTIFGSAANYTCNFGFLLSTGGSQFQRTCGEEGDWIPEAPTCEAIVCESLDPPEDGELSVASSFPFTATYICDVGHELSQTTGEDVFVRECQVDGTYTGEAPTCIIIECEPLTDPTNGMVTLPSITFQSQAMYECDFGHEVTSGSSSRTCMSNGQWSGTEPTCEPVNCPNLMSPDDGTVELTGTIFGSSAMYSCNPGFSLSSPEDETQTCMEDMQWSGSEPTCVLIVCGSLLPPDNGDVALPTVRDVGSVATYTCDAGYELSTGGEEFTRTCMEDSSWSESPPSCSIVDCGAPPSLDDGAVSVAATTFLSEALYSCNDTLTIVGGDLRVCQSNMTWSGGEITCETVDVSIDLGSVTPGMGTSIQEGENITYNCSVGDISDRLLPDLKLTWVFNDDMELASSVGLSFLELTLTGVNASNSGNYSCLSELASGLLSNDSSSVVSVTLAVQQNTPPSPPMTAGFTPAEPDNTGLIVGVVVGVGAGVFLLIFFVGCCVICLLCVHKKHNYKKYVLPYRTYMDAYRNKNADEGGSSRLHKKHNKSAANDIRQWENGRREHVLDAVDMLNKNKK